MTVINGLGPLGGLPTPTRAKDSGGFRVPAEGKRTQEAGATAAVSMPSLLAMQEAETDLVRDREARRHGESLLKALASLQRALLGGTDDAGLERLAGLARAAPVAADPRLAAVQRALLVRVAVELARRQRAASQ